MRLLTWIFFAGAACFLGCASSVRFAIRQEAELQEGTGPVLVVEEFEDRRSREPSGSLWWSFVPGLNAVVELSCPDDAEGLEFRAPADLRRTVTQLARESGRFSEVVLESPSRARPRRVVILKAALERVSVTRRQYNYFLGPIGGVLWILGIPRGAIETDVEMMISVSDNRSRVLWEGPWRGHRSRWCGLYFNADWRRVFVEDLEDLIRRRWRAFWPDLESILEHDP